MFLPWANAKQKRVFWLLLCAAVAMSALLWYVVSRQTHSQKPSNGLVIYAKVMLSIFVGVCLFSLVASLRSPVEPTPEKLARLKKLIFANWLVIFAALGSAIEAVLSKQYYLLLVSALLLGVVLPVVISYIRVKTALKNRPIG